MSVQKTHLWRQRQLSLYPRSFQKIPLAKQSKTPTSKNWGMIAMATEDVENAVANHLNVGLRIPKGAVVIDADPRNYPEGVSSLADLISIYPEIGKAPEISTGGGGSHILMQLPLGVSLSTAHYEYKGIDFKTFGSYIVGAGSLHPNGQYYEWTNKTPIPGSLPSFPITLQMALERVYDPKIHSKRLVLNKGQLGIILQGMSVLNYSRGNYQGWFSVMASVHHATFGEEWALNLFLEWSAKDPAYTTAQDVETTKKSWNTLNPEAVSALTGNTLLYYAMNEGVELPKDLKQEAEIGASVVLSSMNEKHALATRGEQSVILCEEQTVDGLRVTYKQVKDFKYHYENLRLPFEPIYKKGEIEKFKHVNAAEAWMKWTGRRTYDALVFKPSCKEIGEIVKTGEYNLWHGWTTPVGYANTEKLDTLMREVICCGVKEHYEYLMDWLAFVIQYPNRVAGVAVVIKGKKGTGKSTLANLMYQITAPYSATITDKAHGLDKFNSVWDQKVFVCFEEFVWDKKDTTQESMLKSVITEKTIRIERKFQESCNIPNYTHLMIVSNEQQVVPVSTDERRYFVLEVNANYWSRTEERSVFFDELHQELEGGGRNAFFASLLERDISRFQPNRVPATKAMAELKLDSLHPVHKFWYEVVTDDYDNGGIAFGDSPYSILQDDLYVIYERFKVENQIRYDNSGKKGFTSKLKEVLPSIGQGCEIVKTRIVDEDTQEKVRKGCWLLPSREVCKLRMLDAIGRTVQDVEEFKEVAQKMDTDVIDDQDLPF